MDNQWREVFPERRRSARLLQSGYYGPDGRPTISYKENLYKVFKRRRRKRSGTDENTNGDTKPSSHEMSMGEDSNPRKPLFLYLLLLILPVIVGFTLHRTIFPPQYKWKEDSPHSHEDPTMTFTDSPEIPPPILTHEDLENFALLSQKATVLRLRSTDTYYRGGMMEKFCHWWCFKHLWVLQADSKLVPRKCWPFEGDSGHLHIQLSQSVHVTHVTLGHITQTQSPTGETTSAPKHFSVYGMKTLDGEEQLLGQFSYNNQGPSFQTFALPEQDSNGEAFKHVRLKVESNWGNTEYTCLYNFKVHGRPEHPAEETTPLTSNDQLSGPKQPQNPFQPLNVVQGSC